MRPCWTRTTRYVAVQTPTIVSIIVRFCGYFFQDGSRVQVQPRGSLVGSGRVESGQGLTLPDPIREI